MRDPEAQYWGLEGCEHIMDVWRVSHSFDFAIILYVRAISYLYLRMVYGADADKKNALALQARQHGPKWKSCKKGLEPDHIFMTFVVQKYVLQIWSSFVVVHSLKG